MRGGGWFNWREICLLEEQECLKTERVGEWTHLSLEVCETMPMCLCLKGCFATSAIKLNGPTLTIDWSEIKILFFGPFYKSASLQILDDVDVWRRYLCDILSLNIPNNVWNCKLSNLNWPQAFFFMHIKTFTLEKTGKHKLLLMYLWQANQYIS